MEENTGLRVSSDALLRDLELLRSLEEEKRTLPPNDPRFAELALQVEQLAAHVLEVSRTQRDQGERIRELTPHLADLPLEAAAPRPIQDILAEWRDAERRLSACEPGSLEAGLARADADRLRDEYQRAHRSTSDKLADL